MSEPIRSLSHSACDLWAQCPARFKLTRIDKVPRAPSPALILGDAFHTALYGDGDAARGKETRWSLDELIELGESALRDRLAKDDPATLLGPVQELDMRDRLRAMLRAYAETIQPQYQPFAVELELHEPLPGMPDEAGWHFTGIVDALTDRGIVDFKMSSKPWALGAEHSKSQATAYWWLVLSHQARNTFYVCARPPIEREPWVPQQITFLVFTPQRGPAGDYGCVVERRRTTRSRQQVETYLRDVRTTVYEITAAQETGTYPARTGPLCRYCDVQGYCPAGTAWVARDGRGPAVPVLTPDRAASVMTEQVEHA